MRDRATLQEWMRRGCPIVHPLAGLPVVRLGTHAQVIIVAVGVHWMMNVGRGQPRLFVYCRGCGEDRLEEIADVESGRFPDVMDRIGHAVFKLHQDHEAISAVMEELTPLGTGRSARTAVSNLLSHGLTGEDKASHYANDRPFGVTKTPGGLKLEVHYTDIDGVWGQSLVDNAATRRRVG